MERQTVHLSYAFSVKLTGFDTQQNFRIKNIKGITYRLHAGV